MAEDLDRFQLAVLGGAQPEAETYYVRHMVTGETSDDCDLDPFEHPKMTSGRYRVYYRSATGAEVRPRNSGTIYADIGQATTKARAEETETKIATRQKGAVNLSDLARYEREVMATELEEAHLLAGKKMVLAKDQAETLALLRFYRHEITKQQHGNLLVQNGNADLFNRLQQMMIAGMERNASPAAPPPPSAWSELAQLARELMPVLLAHYRPPPPPSNESTEEIQRLKNEINKLNRQKRTRQRKGAGDVKKHT